MSNLHIVFGNQLFPLDYFKKEKVTDIFMCETKELCQYYKFHKHKIILFISAMRHFKLEAEKAGFKVHYWDLSQTERFQSYEKVLEKTLNQKSFKSMSVFEIEDKFMEKRLTNFSLSQKIDLTVLKSPGFLVGRNDFQKYLAKNKKPFMKTFYEKVRQGTKILMTVDGEPIGGQYSFDDENRKPWKANLKAPEIAFPKKDSVDLDVMDWTEKHFSSHPGDVKNFWLPTSRAQALKWMKDFFEQRFKDFGPYEDSITNKEDFLFHSGLSPLINLGLITPKDVVQTALEFSKKNKIPVNSTEGFVRQIIGWREFVRGIYQNYSEKQDQANFWNHQRKMKSTWYTGQTGIPPVDDAIKKAIKLGYNHHIERLMILANIMNLSQIKPQQVHQWFMEMYVDSSDWVMGPNVYGMGLFSDGGIFATKPYIAGSNYIIKMSDYKKADWCDEFDGLYWRFIDTHRDFFAKNYRLSMMVKLFDKMDSQKKNKIFKAADEFLLRNTSK